MHNPSTVTSQRKPKVLVAMSGGVDSSAAAALLVEQGYDVVGATMQVWDYSSCNIEEGLGTCCSTSDVDDARSVADTLGIPFFVINCEEEFKAKVIDPFVSEYFAGRTPLPCVNCNTYLKFDYLIRKMRELECDYLATGHYAKIEKDKAGVPAIVTSTDDWKDQTYFLFTIPPEIVGRLMFPIGHLKKPDVRIYAEQKGLVVARKKDSTGICFVGSRGYEDFIKEHYSHVQSKLGKVRLYPTGAVLAEHQGIHHFTYGQRKGLGFSYSQPLYVRSVDKETGDVWVSEEKDLFKNEMIIERCQWHHTPSAGASMKVKIRYAHKGGWAQLHPLLDESGLEQGRWKVEFSEPQRAITPGQAAVVYDGDRLMGGGWIL